MFLRIVKGIVICASAALAVSCDNGFMGAGGGALGGKKPFQGGNGAPNNNNYGNDGNLMPDGRIMGPNGPYNPNDLNDPNHPFNTNNNNGGNDGFGQGGGDDMLEFGDASAVVVRADSGTGDTGYSNQMQIRLSYNGKDSGWVQMGSKGSTATLQSVCVKGGVREYKIEMKDAQMGAVRFSTNPNTPAPIGKRWDDSKIDIGYERLAIGDGELAYHNWDDFVVRITCDDADAKIKIANLCIDPRIPGNDLVTDDKTYSGDELGRQCRDTI